MKKAVLLVIFNRPETTLKVLQAIRAVRPSRMYVASDGARENIEGEKELVERVRKLVIDGIDWECEVHTLFRDKNLGCGKAVSGGISWFFEHEKDGIILEDDCLPHEDFFRFCETLLDYYSDEKRVWHISGNNFNKKFRSSASYYFAQIEHCWGWATWADRWQSFEYHIKDHKELNYKEAFARQEVAKYWSDIFQKMEKEQDNVWDYQWTYAILKEKGLCINPSKNLVSNIGVYGVHYSGDDPHLNLPTYEMGEILHPRRLELNMKEVEWTYENTFGLKKKTLFRRICVSVTKWLKST
ncbi:MAG: nucleotide-diphospho-sugar transferase [Candidatus Moranbacteria bacterium]|nr:nucleotide-diphospho-sugar transferase [Candidatus Moranbacteria bacterium]